MNRRAFLEQAASAAIVVRGAPALVGVGRADYDLILRDGVIIDGTGRPRFQADLAVTGDRIVRIARRIKERGRREIDVRDHVVQYHPLFDRWDGAILSI